MHRGTGKYSIALRYVWFGVVHTPFCARLFVLDILDMTSLIIILSYVIPYQGFAVQMTFISPNLNITITSVDFDP